MILGFTLEVNRKIKNNRVVVIASTLSYGSVKYQNSIIGNVTYLTNIIELNYFENF